MKDIPFIDLTAQVQALKPEFLEAFGRVCDQNAFSGGPFVAAFEEEYARFIGSGHFVGVSSGSDALLLALRALNIGPGDEVIVPANTFIATVFAVQRLGATPVFADCDPVLWQIDPVSVRAAVTEKTKAIIGVHLYGQLYPVEEIQAIAREFNLAVVEDCAQSQGALYKGRAAGTFGDAGCFSFYPTKNLGACGEGGGVSCAREEIAARIRRMRAQGSDIQYQHVELGYNMRMDGIQAALLSVKLRHLAAWNAARADIVRQYRQKISNPLFTWQGELEYTQPAWYLAVVCVDNREKFLEYMRAQGIRCGVHYAVPCHLQEAMRALGHKPGDFPNAEWEAAHCVSLPLFPEMTQEQIGRVIAACNAYEG